MALPGARHRELAFAFGKTGEIQKSQYRVINLVEVSFTGQPLKRGRDQSERRSRGPVARRFLREKRL